MHISKRLDQIHSKARKNNWLRYFAIFIRVVLALGFLPSGMQKVLGVRFTVLSVNHPMGNFLEAFYHTGFYYPFVGAMQVLAAILLLIPRTVTIGALIYLPIILNICILSLAVRFDGSLVTSPLMLCGVLYLLCWDYHKFKNVFPFNDTSSKLALPKKNEIHNRFPFSFLIAVITVILIVLSQSTLLYKIMPRNTLEDCRKQCNDEDIDACIAFCDCIHKDGNSLNKCLDEFKK